jgi:hypothetical protein
VVGAVRGGVIDEPAHLFRNAFGELGDCVWTSSAPCRGAVLVGCGVFRSTDALILFSWLL